MMIIELLLGTALSAATNYQFECTDDQLKKFASTDLVYADYSTASEIYYSKNSVRFDKKSKVVQTWTHDFLTPTGASGFHYNKRAGVLKTLRRFDTKSKESVMIAFAVYSCDGDTLESMTIYNPSWDPVVPGSTAESVMKDLTKIYLK